MLHWGLLPGALLKIHLTFRVRKNVTDAPNCSNQSVTGFELLAQTADVYVERSIRGSCFAPKQSFGDLVARYDAAGRASQQIKDVELHCGQIYQAVTLPHLPTTRIDTNFSELGDHIAQMV